MDGSDVDDALDEALDSFQSSRKRTVEEGLETGGDKTLVQLRKSCRLLDSCRTLRSNDGYHTSVIELSLGAIERSIQFYLAYRGGRDPGEFRNHEAVYQEGAEINLYSTDVRDRLITLWKENRSALYYRNAVATGEQAEAAFVLAETLHRWIIDYGSVGHECRCRALPEAPYQER